MGQLSSARFAGDTWDLACADACGAPRRRTTRSTMTRTDQDTWDLASSVGATATMVAAARALASAEPHPIINDPFAAPLVRSVGLNFFIRLVDGEVTASKTDEGADR